MKRIIPLLILILLLAFGWFYWTELRPNDVRKKCYIDVFVSDKNNTKWSEGKVWRNLGWNGRDSIWGWGYAGSTEDARFNDCLLLNNVNPAEK